MSNNTIIISEDKEVYKSLERAFRISNITAWKWDDYLKNKTLSNAHPVLIFTVDRDSLYDWIWNEVRGRYKLLNPTIAIGFHCLDSTIDLRDLIFEKNYETYQYFKIPFLLDKIFHASKKLKSLKNQKERKLDFESFSQPRMLLNKVDHELIGVFGSGEKVEIKKERAIGFYTRASEMLQDLDSRNELMTDVRQVICEIEKSTLSDAECRKFKLITETLFSKILSEI